MTKTLVVLAAMATFALGGATAYAQVAPNNPDGPSSSEEPAPPPEPPAPPPTPPSPPDDDDDDGLPDFVGATDPQSVMDVLTIAGVNPVLGKNNVGRTRITFTFMGAETSIFYYDCHDGMGDCDSIRFVHGLDFPDGVSLAAVNRWNDTEPWGRAFVDDNDDPWLDMSLWMGSSMPYSIFNSVMRNWTEAATKFRLHFEDD